MSKPAVLVPDVQTRAQLAALRSLGRAGYIVHAMAARPDAMGLRSRYARHRVVAPAYDSRSFVEWLQDYCRSHAIAMIVPSGGLLGAVRTDFADVKPLLPVASDPAAVYRLLDKAAVIRFYQQHGLMTNHPRSLIVDSATGADSARLAELGAPIYVKTDDIALCGDAVAAARVIRAAAPSPEAPALAQQAVGGIQVGVSVLLGDAGPIALTCVRDSHEKPHSNGTMSLRHSWWHQGMVDDAVRRLTALGWRGCAMAEYRWEPASDSFNVIEINARFWQYLHLDIHAGVDFPRLLAEWHIDGAAAPAPRGKLGVVCRDDFPGEVAWLANAIRDPDASFAARTAAAVRFVRDSLDPRYHRDLSFPGDRGIWWRELGRFVAGELQPGRDR